MIRVLVADDDAAVRSALCDLLTSDPELSVVALCADGTEALRALQSVTPDLAVLDVRMPNGGVDLVRAFSDRGVRVVCFSADEESSHTMLSAGARAFLAKSGEILDLAKTLRAIAVG